MAGAMPDIRDGFSVICMISLDIIRGIVHFCSLDTVQERDGVTDWLLADESQALEILMAVEYGLHILNESQENQALHIADKFELCMHVPNFE